MVIEYILLAIQIFMLVTLLVMVFVIAQILAISTQARDAVTANKNGKNLPSDKLIEQIADRVEAIDRELNPKDGASLSYRVNELTKSADKTNTAFINARSAVEEARNSVSTASAERQRLQQAIAVLQSTAETLLVATAKATEAAVKIIQNTVQATESKIDSLTAGNEAKQTHTRTEAVAPIPATSVGVIAKLEKGAEKVSEGAETIQKGINQMKDEK